MNIRRATSNDAIGIAEIYSGYVRNTTVTFEADPVSPEEMAERIREKLVRHDWLVATLDDRVVGYAYYGTFRARRAYDHTVESAIYLSHDAVGQRIGRALYTALIESAKDHGFRELLGVIALPNPASIKLHEAMGFEQVGLLLRVGRKFGSHLDVALWQLSLG